MYKIIALLVLLAAILGGAYYLFFRVQELNVKIDFDAPEEVLMGEEFDLVISYANNSTENITNAKLSVSLPENVYFVGKSETQRVTEDSIGDMETGGVSKKSYRLLALKETDSVKRIEARITYSLESSSSQFESKDKVDIVVGSPAVDLNIDAPESVFSGEEFELVLNYKNQSKKDIKNARIIMEYPPAYTFLKADPAPDSTRKEWDLKTLMPGAQGKITLRGSAIGQDDAMFAFNSSIRADFGGESYDLENISATVKIRQAPLSVEIGVNNNENYVAKIGDTLRYTFIYRNNSNTPLQNLVLRASFSGELFDFSSVRSNGSFNSLTNTVFWNTGSVPEFQNIAPGEQRSVDVEINLKGTFPIRRLSDKNYLLKVNAQIESPTVPTGVTASKTISISSLETKVSGQVELESYALYYEPIPTGIKNSGPYPPKVNQATTYTVHWKVKNYSTDVSSVKVSAFLKSGATFTGKVGPTDNPPKYNSLTGEITWEIPRIPATIGVIGAPNEVVFQIQHTPGSNQVGQSVILMSESTITAKDDFTGLALENKAYQITTDLLNDPKVTANDRRVRP